MKSPRFITVFIATQIACVFLQIHKHSLFIKQSYRKQHADRIHDELQHKKQQLTQQLYALQSHSEIQKFATDQLKMTHVQLHQIKKLENHG